MNLHSWAKIIETEIKEKGGNSYDGQICSKVIFKDNKWQVQTITST